MADESDAKKDNFKDNEEFDSLLKEYKRKNKELYVTLVSLRHFVPPRILVKLTP